MKININQFYRLVKKEYIFNYLSGFNKDKYCLDFIVKSVAVILIVLFNSTITLGGTRDPNTPDSKYIEYGKKHKCVIKIQTTTKENQKAHGSAVVIDPDWILTAAHIVKNSSNTKIVLDDKKEIIIDEIFIPDEYDEKKVGLCDIALCKLHESINLDFYPELYEKEDEVGKICSISGFGVTGMFSSNERTDDGIRRAGSNRIENIDRHLLVCNPGIQGKTELEFLISHGDSGGGLFIDKKLAGVNSCVMAADKNPNSSYGDECGHTRVSIYKNWIKNIIKK